MRLSFLCMFVLDANMDAMARSLSAKERARVGAIVPAMARGEAPPHFVSAHFPRGGEIVECPLRSQFG
jgi:hypothetical protein